MGTDSFFPFFEFHFVQLGTFLFGTFLCKFYSNIFSNKQNKIFKKYINLHKNRFFKQRHFQVDIEIDSFNRNAFK